MSDAVAISWSVIDLKSGGLIASTDDEADALEWRDEVERGEWGEVGWTGFDRYARPVGDYVKWGKPEVEHVVNAENIYGSDSERLTVLADEFFAMMPQSGGMRQAMWLTLRQVMGQAWLDEKIEQGNEIDRALREREAGE